MIIYASILFGLKIAALIGFGLYGKKDEFLQVLVGICVSFPLFGRVFGWF